MTSSKFSASCATESISSFQSLSSPFHKLFKFRGFVRPGKTSRVSTSSSDTHSTQQASAWECDAALTSDQTIPSLPERDPGRDKWQGGAEEPRKKIRKKRGYTEGDKVVSRAVEFAAKTTTRAEVRTTIRLVASPSAEEVVTPTGKPEEEIRRDRCVEDGEHEARGEKKEGDLVPGDEPVLQSPRPTSNNLAVRFSVSSPSLIVQATDDQSRPSSAHIPRKPLRPGSSSSTTHPTDRPHPSPPPDPIQSSTALLDFDLDFAPPSISDLTLHDPQLVTEPSSHRPSPSPTPPPPSQLQPQSQPPVSPSGSVSPTSHVRPQDPQATTTLADEPAPPAPLHEPVPPPARAPPPDFAPATASADKLAPLIPPPPIPPPERPARLQSPSIPPSPPPPPDVSPTGAHAAVEAQTEMRLRKSQNQSPPTMPLHPPPPSLHPPPPPRRDSLAAFDDARLRGRLADPHVPRPRSSSYHHQARKSSLPMPPVPAMQYPVASPAPEPRGSSPSAQRPSTASANTGFRAVSNPAWVGSQSPPRDDKRGGKLRRSWLPGGRSRSGSQDMGRASQAPAWMLGGDVGGEYKTTFLLSGEKVRLLPGP